MTEHRIAQVVVACDVVGENQACVETAARLADWLDATLRGIFVEDEALLHLTAIPPVRYVGPTGESFAAMDERSVLHQFESHAARMRAVLEAAARARELGWTFDVVRGQPNMAILNMGDQDLLVIEMQSRPFAGSARLASRLLTAVLQSKRPVLLLRSGAAAAHDIVCMVQGTEESAARVIVLAARLASAGKRSLTLFLATEGGDDRGALKLVHSVSPELAQRCRIERPSQNILASTAAAGRLLVVDADPTINDAAALRNLLATTQADILFLR
jgi:nucleotide-binding universal stress UspA family protein